MEPMFLCLLRNCHAPLVGGRQQEPIPFSAVHVLLSVTAFFGNPLILVALHK